MREHLGIEPAQERDGVDVLAPAIFVRHPAAGRAAVIEIEHRGDRIDAQAIDAVAVEPEQRVRQQEVGHFDAAEIVDQRAPVEVPALARIGVLVERGAVEAARARADRRGNAPAPSRAARRGRPRGSASISATKSAGEPKRLVGANSPVG